MRTTMYLHSSKDVNRSVGAKLGLSEQAMENFKYALYEVALEVEVDETTGNTKILSCDGKALAHE